MCATKLVTGMPTWPKHLADQWCKTMESAPPFFFAVKANNWIVYTHPIQRYSTGSKTALLNVQPWKGMAVRGICTFLDLRNSGSSK